MACNYISIGELTFQGYSLTGWKAMQKFPDENTYARSCVRTLNKCGMVYIINCQDNAKKYFELNSNGKMKTSCDAQLSQ